MASLGPSSVAGSADPAYKKSTTAIKEGRSEATGPPNGSF